MTNELQGVQKLGALVFFHDFCSRRVAAFGKGLEEPGNGSIILCYRLEGLLVGIGFEKCRGGRE